jgi:hypothetical protein
MKRLFWLAPMSDTHEQLDALGSTLRLVCSWLTGGCKSGRRMRSRAQKSRCGCKRTPLNYKVSSSVMPRFWPSMNSVDMAISAPPPIAAMQSRACEAKPSLFIPKKTGCALDVAHLVGPGRRHVRCSRLFQVASRLVIWQPSLALFVVSNPAGVLVCS